MNNTSETVSIKKLTGWDKNPRGIKKDDYNRLKKQIQDLGVYKPLLVNEDYVVLGGNMRLKVLTDLGVENVWVSVVKASTPEMMTKYALSDNDEAGYYEEQALAELLMPLEINLDDYRVNLGKPISITELLAKFGPDVIEDEPPVVEEEAISKRGEIYQLGRHRLMCGDATSIEDVEALMDGKKADMVFTDPPYNVDYTGGMGGDGNKPLRDKIANDSMTSDQFYEFLFKSVSNMISVTDGAFYICMSSSELHNLWKAFTDAGGHWQTYIIWAKDSFTLSRSDYQHQFEPIMYGLVEEAVNRAINEVDEDKLPIMYGWTKHSWYGGRKQGDVWRIDRPKISREHPTMKPIALCAKAINNSSTRGQIVLDTFMGSGSTLIACEQVDRTCYGIEFDPRYCDVIRKRYALFIGKGDEWEATTPIA
jgi:DNA modification methylase